MSNENKPKGNIARVELTPPWVIDGQHRYFTNSTQALDEKGMRAFIRERSAVHRDFIRETEKTRRFGYGLSAGLLSAAIVIPTIAPEGREVLSLATSGGLALFAAGAFGYSKLRLSALKQKVVAEKK
jgi:hypothetical protein